jgi:hypothetical protein
MPNSSFTTKQLKTIAALVDTIDGDHDTDTKITYIVSLFEAREFTIEQAEEVITYLTEKHGKAIDLGLSPEAAAFKVRQEYEKRENEKVREEERKRRMEKDRENIQEIKNAVEGIDFIEDPKNREAKLKAASDALSNLQPKRIDTQQLLKRTRWNDVTALIKNTPGAFETSYKMKGDNLCFPVGALSVIAAPTGHGKTTFLWNLLIDAAKKYPDKRHWLFSYEESKEAVHLKTLNAYCDQDFSKNNRSTLKSYYQGEEDYFKEGTKGDFKNKEAEYKELVEKGTINITYADYSSEELIEGIKEIADDNPGIILIDYLQLIYPSKREGYAQRYEELKTICLDLKDTAVSCNLPIIAAAQFSRRVTNPLKLIPQEISDASDIEKAANKIMGLWNGDKEAVYQQSGDKKDLEALGFKDGKKQWHMYVKVLKARDEESGIHSFYEWNGNRGVIEKTPAQNDTKSKGAII